MLSYGYEALAYSVVLIVASCELVNLLQKTILFITLGMTLLVVSFLYNKYKDIIFKVEASENE